MKLTDKMAYVRGMIDGMDLDLTSTKEGRVLGQLLELMQTMTDTVTDLQDQVDELSEMTDLLDQDLGDVENILYDDMDMDVYDNDNSVTPRIEDTTEDIYETVCPKCEHVLPVDEATLDAGEMKCPYCGELLEFDYSDLEPSEDAGPAEDET